MKLIHMIKEKQPVILKTKKGYRINPVWIGLITILLWNNLVYIGSRFLAGKRYHYCLEIPLDDKIPFLPWTVSIYLICYIFWGINYVIAITQSEEEAWRFIHADLFAKLVCLFFFLFLPTTNLRPEVGTGTVWQFLMRVVYAVDQPDNLFPSIHCLVSWFCFIGVRKNPNVSRGYRLFSLIFALLVCVSTLTTKQHVLVDTIAGILLAEGSYFAAAKSGISDRIRILVGRKYRKDMIQ